MKQNWKNLVCLCFVLAAPTSALAQGTLVLPQSADDIRQLTQEENTGPCVKCGVVTNVRSESRASNARRSSALPPASGIGNSVTTTPIVGSGTAVKDARAANKPETYYKITVRYDDGQYAVFEQDDEPEMNKGDRVEAVEGRLRLRLN